MTSGKNKASGAGVGWLRDKRVLLAEDNITNQMVATQMLDALGAKVDVANDGAEALEMIAAAPYDLFLIDIEMPRVSGLDVIRSIRNSTAPLCDAPVIAVTAYALREHREKITEAGADGLIPKPLLGIEQFGRDIVNLADRGGAGVGRAAAAEPPRVEQPEGPATAIVSMEIYGQLKDAIGEDAMADLLGKIDGDLAAAHDRLSSGVSDGSRDEIAAASHVLISVAGAIGATPLQVLAQKVSGIASGRGSGDLMPLARQAVGQIGAVRAFVKGQLEDFGR
ncbi:response regulator [Rubrimonas cliftonensis]|uniref:CheY chemotaxis protein or a CheY-like REC (Receiver) domain n=1 Tax=Rubrimonas cliftonensis TaxID=89524 RepID=A0A1H4DXD4_9RHOB|nr:response regulator [Rubrimonas cliftonensis]SEA76872.1 CheY chemotaxis protein or a CheY-like REC (receiver) domain [Rubrimonas cliftonensis]